MVELQKFVDELPIPKVLQPNGNYKGQPYYEITMKEVYQKLHRDLHPTKVWGYNGQYPGPSIEAFKDEDIYVMWKNDLPVNHHLLPVDRTIHGAEPGNPTVRTVVHVHGANVPTESDGYPEAWFTNGFRQVGPYFTNKIYWYPNKQEASTLWYHDHALGITRLNVYAGLAGFYILHDENEKKLDLPKGKYDIPLAIQDRSFNADGSLFYPFEPDPPVPNVYPSIVPEFFGDKILVNGKVWPYLNVEPRKYRFRLLNGSNSRFYTITLSSENNIVPAWVQIATEQSLLEEPVPFTELTLGPGERAEVIIDFKSFNGLEIVLKNSAPTPFPNGAPVDPDTTGQIMLFKVVLPLSDEKDPDIPRKLSEIKRLDPKEARIVRDLTLVEETDEFGRLLLLLEGLRWDDPITTRPILGSVEVWNLINLTVDSHPIHLHLVQFQVLERQPFDVDRYNTDGQIVYTGDPIPPDPNERGWKDTVKANPGEITRIISRFVDFADLFPWHCHILEHEDHEMMRPYRVVKRPHK
jgi:spore coat protein A, manganese oxidase